MDNVQLLDEQQASQEFVQSFQGSFSDTYNLFNMFKTSFSLIEKLTHATGSLAAVLDVLLPVGRLVLFSLKSTWDLVVLLKTHPGKAQMNIPVTANDYEKGLLHLADARKGKANLVKCGSMTVIALGLVAAAMIIPTSAVSFGIAGSALNILNEMLNYRFHALKLTETRLLIADKSSQLLRTVKPEARATLQSEIRELKQSEKQQTFDLHDRKVKLAMNMMYMAAFVTMVIPGMQVVATAMFLTTMVASFAYSKKGQSKLKAHCGVVTKSKPKGKSKTSMATNLMANSCLWQKPSAAKIELVPVQQFERALAR